MAIILDKIVVSKTPPTNTKVLWIKQGKLYYYSNGWRCLDSDLESVEGYIDDKVKEVEDKVSTEVKNQIDDVIGGASEDYNTFEELEQYIVEHTGEVESVKEDIETNKTDINDLKEQINSITPEGSGWNDVL